MNNVCLICGARQIGNVNKRYCGSIKQLGSCAHKASLQLSRLRYRYKNEYKTIEAYLYSLGGRTKQDLEKDENGKRFVTMWNGIIHAPVRFYLPNWLQ